MSNRRNSTIGANVHCTVTYVHCTVTYVGKGFVPGLMIPGYPVARLSVKDTGHNPIIAETKKAAVTSKAAPYIFFTGTETNQIAFVSEPTYVFIKNNTAPTLLQSNRVSFTLHQIVHRFQQQHVVEVLVSTMKGYKYLINRNNLHLIVDKLTVLNMM